MFLSAKCLSAKTAPFPEGVEEGAVVYCTGRLPSPHCLLVRITKIWKRWEGTIHGINLITEEKVDFHMYMGDNLPQLDFWGFTNIQIIPPEEVEPLLWHMPKS